jgi:hypothetical protein
MSWFYRFFKKSDDEQTVTVTAPAIALTGAVAVTGALTQTGAVGITGNETVTGNLTVTSTIRNTTSPFFLGSGTLGVFFGTATPWDTGVSNADKGSLYCQTLSTGSIYRKYGFASKEWATLVATTVATY